MSCSDDTLKSRRVKRISMAPSQFWHVLLGLHAQIEKCKSESHGSTAVFRCRQSSPAGLSLSPSSSALGSLGTVLLLIPFGAQAFKVERYREDQHGPCTVSSRLAWMSSTNREVQVRFPEGSLVRIGTKQRKSAWPPHSSFVCCLDDTRTSRSVYQISMAAGQFHRVLLG